MKKQFTLLFIAISILAISCSKDNGTATEQPIAALFADNALSDVALNDTFIDDGYYEFGFVFSVTKNGKVTQLGIHNPDAGTVRATLWDLTDTSIIVQKSITVTAHVPKYETLASAVALSTGKRYAITMLSDDYYWRERTGSVDYPYPVTKGNIKIEDYGYRSADAGDPALYPNGFYQDYLAGIVDFTYETEN